MSKEASSKAVSTPQKVIKREEIDDYDDHKHAIEEFGDEGKFLSKQLDPLCILISQIITVSPG